jgi:hypothetical protein
MQHQPIAVSLREDLPVGAIEFGALFADDRATLNNQTDTIKGSCFVATIENVKLEISASAANPAHSLISYSYELCPDAEDCAAQREFTVTVGLWGQDLLDDDVLATDLDQHTVSVGHQGSSDTVRVERGFEVETKLLDEDLVGDDEVFLIVEARDGANRVSGKSNTVIGYF